MEFEGERKAGSSTTAIAKASALLEDRAEVVLQSILRRLRKVFVDF